MSLIKIMSCVIVTIVVSLRLMTTFDWDNWKISYQTAKGEYKYQLLCGNPKQSKRWNASVLTAYIRRTSFIIVNSSILFLSKYRTLATRSTSTSHNLKSISTDIKKLQNGMLIVIFPNNTRHTHTHTIEMTRFIN